ncbi:MAG: 6-hydroxymethylpterin diphosphokinase MptE-like protein, partial [Candidatus Thorarchaeota archaeon]
MEWSKWQPIYLDIVQRLELDTSKDREATALLTRILEDTEPQPLLDQMQELIDGKSVVVCGAGPSLEQHVQRLKAEDTYENHVIVAADGAVSVLLEHDVECDVVVTDLDGTLEHLMEMKRRGAILIVHGHGDNI